MSSQVNHHDLFELSRRESIDITSITRSKAAPAQPQQRTEDLNQDKSANVKRKEDFVEEFFLASTKPNVTLFAISIMVAGVMDLLPHAVHDPDIWTDRLDLVNGFYGPGAVMSWCIMSISMLYDANESFATKADAFHYFKYASLIFTGVWALGDAVWRACRIDFGPSYAAALYMSDKAFEVAVLLYTLHLFPIHRKNADTATRRRKQQRLDEERAIRAQRGSQSLQSQAVAAIAKYKIFPCIPMVSVWVWCRALANGHDVYNINAQNPHGVTIGWRPILAWYFKPVLVAVCFAFSSLVGISTGWGWQSWGLPVGILSSVGAMHTGLFGTVGPLKLTAIPITDTDQIAALVSTLLLLMVQYGREIRCVKRTAKKLKILLFGDRVERS